MRFPKRFPIPNLLITTGVLVSLILVVVMIAGSVAKADVDPPMVMGELAPGESMIVEKVVTTPEISPTVDVVISMDLTGSMGGELVALKAQISSIITTLSGAAADLHMGIVSHEDYNGAFNSNPTCNYNATYGSGGKPDVPYRLDHALDTDFVGADASVQAMTLGFGNDGPESYARVMNEAAADAAGDAVPGIGYRTGAQKVLVMFLDNIPHDCDLGDNLAGTVTGIDPGRDAAVGTVDDIDLQDDALANMVAQGITLLVVSSGPASHTTWWNTQAAATGGSAVQINSDGSVPGGISLADLILNLIKEVKTDVWWQVNCDPGLNVVLNPVVHFGVSGGSIVGFTETITVANDPALQGTSVHCEVTFFANHYPKEGQVIGVEKIWIDVPDVTKPEAGCVETENPAGKNIPKAPGTGQNEDGFYKLLATDNLDPTPQIFVVDMGTDNVFGTLDDTVFPAPPPGFSSGTRIKYTEANGAVPSIKKMGGPGSAVDWHITGRGDAAIYAVDAAGNQSAAVICRVPPPPK